MIVESSKRVRVAERTLIIQNSKCRWMHFVWFLVFLLLPVIITGAVLGDPEVLTALCGYIPMVGAMLYGSASEDGPYAQRRRAKWRLEDLREEVSEEIVRDFT